MTQITAELIKKLREASGAGMMDCKKALNETGGDFEAASDWLRKQGLSAAAKKAGRVASDGLVGIFQDGNKAAIVEVNSETDFVAKNDQFQEVVSGTAKAAFEVDGDIEKLKEFTCPESGKKVSEVIVDTIASIGENISIRRSSALSVSEGVVATYIHNTQAPGLGKIGVLVALESSGDKEKLTALGKQLAMHVAASKPEALNIEDVKPEAVEREKDIFFEQAKDSGKPQEIIEKMVEGRIRKYYEQVVFVEQAFVIDGKTKISTVLQEAEKDVGAPIKISGFVQFTLGEGIEKEEDNFAEEVAAAVGAS